MLATLIRLLGVFDLAEDALHDAFLHGSDRAVPSEGVPDNPRAWLVTTGRFKATDRIRRRPRFDASLAQIADDLHADAQLEPESDTDGVEDDRYAPGT